jgi:hypothetical protein
MCIGYKILLWKLTQKKNSFEMINTANHASLKHTYRISSKHGIQWTSHGISESQNQTWTALQYSIYTDSSMSCLQQLSGETILGGCPGLAGDTCYLICFTGYRCAVIAAPLAIFSEKFPSKWSLVQQDKTGQVWKHEKYSLAHLHQEKTHDIENMHAKWKQFTYMQHGCFYHGSLLLNN